MPYASVKSLPAAVKAKIKEPKRRRQWMHVFNSAYAAHGDESRAFAEAWAATKSAGGVAKRLKISKAEANYKDQTIDDEHCSVCTMFRPPNSCTLVKGDVRPGGWCKFFERKAGAKPLGKAAAMNEFKVFLPICKVDKEKRTVQGYASTPSKDLDGEIVTLDAVKKALPSYMEWRNIREMHRLEAVGVAQEANVDTKGLFLTAKIVDDAAWKKCLEGVYKGFSIGGRKLDKVGDKITEIDLTEISIVDRPANPDCRISIAKSAKQAEGAEGHLLKAAKAQRDPNAKALAKMAKIVGNLAKAGPPAAHDGFSLPAPGPNRSPKDEVVEVNKAGDKPGEGKFPYGDVEYADPGLRSDKKKRYPIDTEEHIRAAWNYINKPKNAAKYGGNAGKVKSKIVSAWKSKIDPAGPPSAKGGKKAKKAAKAAMQKAIEALDLGEATFLDIHAEPKAESAPPSDRFTLDKGMSAAANLSNIFDSIRCAQRCLLTEAKREGGDMKDVALAKELGDIAQHLAGVIGQKALHEGKEAQDLSDADDQYLPSLLGEDFKMAAGNGNDDLNQVITEMVKRATKPTRAQRLDSARKNLKEVKKARRGAMKAIEAAHKMHKAAFLAKAAKAKGKEPEADEFDHAGAMEKLQKAFGEIRKLGTFAKAANEQIKKAAARSGERGEEAGDAEPGFYEVPAGVKDLSPAALAGASPGGKGGGGQPPMYPGDGAVYPGKAANGGDLRKTAKNVSPELLEMALEKAKMEGELEALRRLPAAAMNGGRRPYAFDLTKVTGGGNGSANAQELNKALFEGVDPSALMSGDENTHNAATAKVIGNFLTSGAFGKSILDPSFHGAAGSRA